MAKILEFVGKSRVRRDFDATAAAVQRRHPMLSEAGVREVVRGLLFTDPARSQVLVVHLLGADILTDDPESLPAWSLITPHFRHVIQTADDATKHAMIDPKGMERTYVWCHAGGWIQEVTDHDIEIIRASDARMWFRDRDAFGAFTPKNAFHLPVVKSIPISSADEYHQFQRDRRRQKSWAGR